MKRAWEIYALQLLICLVIIKRFLIKEETMKNLHKSSNTRIFGSKVLGVIALMLVTTLMGCASQIMQGYVGRDVRDIMLDYGPPSNAIDLADGRRAFQWTIGSSYTMPMTATTTGTVNNIGSTAWVNTNTQITGGQTINSRCLYTLFARWNEGSNGWIVTDFKKPNLMCE